MWRRLSIAAILLLAVAANSWATPKAAYVWNRMADGFFYATYSFTISETGRTTIYAFQIDPSKYKISTIIAPDEVNGSTVREMAAKEKALLTINGGFFTPEHKSIGLIVKDGKTLRPLHNTSWWSVFSLKDNKASISSPKDFKISPEISMAVQAGPRLAIDGTIPKLKESVATRSAIGVNREGMVVIAITEGYGISMNELARRMSATRWDGGLECPNAMALDGGSSSQLYAKIGKFELSLEGIARVTNSVAVFRK